MSLSGDNGLQAELSQLRAEGLPVSLRELNDWLVATLNRPPSPDARYETAFRMIYASTPSPSEFLDESEDVPDDSGKPHEAKSVEELERELAALLARLDEGRKSLEELDAITELMTAMAEGDTERFDALTEKADRARPASDIHSASDILHKFLDTRAPTPEISGRIGEILEANERALLELEHARPASGCTFYVDWSGGPGPSTAMIARIKYAADLLCLAAVNKSDQSPGDAFALFNRALSLLTAFDHVPLIMTHLARGAQLRRAVDVLVYLLSRHRPARAVLAELVGLSRRVLHERVLQQVLTGELCFVLTSIEYDETDMTDTAMKLVRNLRDRIRAAQQPYPERFEVLSQIDEVVNTDAEALPDDDDDPAVMAMLNFTMSTGSDELGMRLVYLLRLILAIELARNDTGNLPAKLSELVPAYLDGIPLDPVSQKMPTYQVRSGGYRISYPCNHEQAEGMPNAQINARWPEFEILARRHD